jgi:hypothetical protein
MRTIVNKTGHAITISHGGKYVELLPAGDPIRLKEVRKPTKHSVLVGGKVVEALQWGGYETNEAPDAVRVGFPIVEKRWEADESVLPKEQDGVYYVVSALVANAFPTRRDLLCPETKKGEDGQIYCTALVRAVPDTMPVYYSGINAGQEMLADEIKCACARQGRQGGIFLDALINLIPTLAEFRCIREYVNCADEGDE